MTSYLVKNDFAFFALEIPVFLQHQISSDRLIYSRPALRLPIASSLHQSKSHQSKSPWSYRYSSGGKGIIHLNAIAERRLSNIAEDLERKLVDPEANSSIQAVRTSPAWLACQTLPLVTSRQVSHPLP